MQLRPLAPWISLAVVGLAFNALLCVGLLSVCLRSCGRSGQPSGRTSVAETPSGSEGNQPKAQIRQLDERETAAAIDAILLLETAVDSKAGQMVALERTSGLELRVADKYFCRPGDGPREAARWREAVQSLYHMGYVESLGSRPYRYNDSLSYEYFRVTADGYGLVDRVRKKASN